MVLMFNQGSVPDPFSLPQVEHCLRALMQRTLHAAFATWREEVDARRELRLRLAGALAALTNRTLYSAWIAWLDHVADR